MCVFCKIIAGQEPAKILQEWTDAIAIRPINPVTAEHALIIPKKHVENMSSSPATTALTMLRAAEYSRKFDSCNIITSKGRAATQTVFHLHVHVIPRNPNDGLKLPWSK